MDRLDITPPPCQGALQQDNTAKEHVPNATGSGSAKLADQKKCDITEVDFQSIRGDGCGANDSSCDPITSGNVVVEPITVSNTKENVDTTETTTTLSLKPPEETAVAQSKPPGEASKDLDSSLDNGGEVGEVAEEDNNDNNNNNNNNNNDDDDDDDDDDGDPIPSGTGVVNRECSASELVGWSEILPKWHIKLNQRPKGLGPLVRCGIPDPLRGEVWQLLSGAQQGADLMEQYRIFLTKTAPTEQIILRDVHRTYPAHENFRTGAGSSSLLESLFKVCKAYAVYDEEVGYCQGLSFLVAALLLHMPEEQAFCVFVRIMQHYRLRDLFRNNFDALYLKFYQLEHLLEDHMPDLHRHFNNIGIEPFTYASQWFLTVFTAKFPLNAVFYIMDIFLLDGMDTIFQIALALLNSSKQELLVLDFEGVLKYFRVQMPKRYRSQQNVQQLIDVSTSISLKQLKKHAKNYEAAKLKEKLLENPMIKLQHENAKLTENILRLEQENDDIARDLVASKIQLRAQLDILEDKAETLNRALNYSRQDCQTYLNNISDIEDEKSRLEIEVGQLKEVCRRELHRAESELARDTAIINDYKKICSSLSKRLDNQIDCVRKFANDIGDAFLDNDSCTERMCHETFVKEVNELLDKLSSDTGNSNNSNTNNNDDQQQKATRSTETSPKASHITRRVSGESASSSQNKPVGAYLKSSLDSQATSSEIKIKQLTDHVDDLEVELARTKLALVEAECKCQQLSHDLNVGVAVKVSSSSSDLQTSTLANKLDSMRAAVSSGRRRPPPSTTTTTGSALTKINNLINERISNLGVKNHSNSMPI